jgi:hypothetical protein
MHKSIAVAFGVAILAVVAYSGLGAQDQPLTSDDRQPVYLPQPPQTGDTIYVDGDPGLHCRVEAVRREWVLCAALASQNDPSSARRSRWHNVYNGHTYTVLKPEK